MFIKSIIKYITEGCAVGVAVYLIPTKKLKMQEILIIAITASAIFAILDEYSTKIASGTRQGMGLGIGLQHVGVVGLGGYGIEGFDVSDTNVCSINNNTCSYTPTATKDQQEKFLCTMNNNTCVPVPACLNNNGTCSLVPSLSSNNDIKGRTCGMKKLGNSNECLLTQGMPTMPTMLPSSQSITPNVPQIEHYIDYMV